MKNPLSDGEIRTIFVREPMNRLVSAWGYKIKNRGTGLNPDQKRLIRDVMKINNPSKDITIPFSAFAEWVAMGNAFSNQHWRPVYAQCPCSSFNFIGHLETMDDDFR